MVLIPPKQRPHRLNFSITRPTACPVCSYDLAGLSERGCCPECGRPFAPETILGSNASGPSLYSEAVVLLFLFGFAIKQTLAPDKMSTLETATLWPAVILVGLGYPTIFFLAKRPLVHTIYIQFDASGIVYRNWRGRITQQPWEKGLHITLLRENDDYVYSLIVQRRFRSVVNRQFLMDVDTVQLARKLMRKWSGQDVGVPR